jgi:hypothetical protein
VKRLLRSARALSSTPSEFHITDICPDSQPTHAVFVRIKESKARGELGPVQVARTWWRFWIVRICQIVDSEEEVGTDGSG